jgi:GDP-mannose 4,6-dehydratase
MTSKVLITGITGMVGSFMAEYLIKNTSWKIIGLIRWRSDLRNLEAIINEINKKNRIELEYGDLNDETSLKNIFKKHDFKYIFHLAAHSFPKSSFLSPMETLNTNIIGTCKLLEAAKEYCKNAKIHVCSSSEVFGRVPKEQIPIKEDCRFHPASPYAISKSGTDLIASFYAQAYKMKIIITRMFTHTGPRRGDIFAESTFAKQIALIEAGQIEPIIKVGNLKSLRTIADVRDAVRAYYILLTKKPKYGEAYNIGGNFTCSVGELLDHLIKISTLDKKKIKIVRDPSRIREIDADLQIPDTSKFKNHTGWEPEISFEQTMLDLLNFWRNEIKKGRKLSDR